VPVLALFGVPHAATCIRLGSLTFVTAAAIGYTRWDTTPTVVVSTLAGVLLVTMVSFVSARFAEHLARVLEDVRAVADTAQETVLPALPRTVGRHHVEGRYLAAAPQARIGGDFYAVAETSFGARVIIGDVPGHGLDAVRAAASVVAEFRNLAPHEPTLPGIAIRLHLAVTNLDGGPPFVTALLAQIPDGGGPAELITCGHPPPLVVRDRLARPVDLDPPCPPLGFRFDAVSCRTHLLDLARGDRLLLYTDGVSEARDARSQPYPLADRAAALHHDDLSVYLDALRADLLRHTSGGFDDPRRRPPSLLRRHRPGRLGDDAALLVIQRTGVSERADADGDRCRAADPAPCSPDPTHRAGG
jgi:hypothetical protein